MTLHPLRLVSHRFLSIVLPAMTLLGNTLLAQGGPPFGVILNPSLPTTCPNTVVAFVDPITGVDPLPSPPSHSSLLTQLNNPRKPFRTIQLAIDACQLGVIHYYTNPSIPINTESRGVVVCMPGVYGPTGVQAGPKDELPIVIRDRVSLQGSGARRTILRGGGEETINVFWPNAAVCGSVAVPRKVLIDLSTQHDHALNPYYEEALPWEWTGDSEEMIDAFGFQGGDVQVYFEDEASGLGRVSNCLFDMRHDSDGISGPYFGVLAVHLWDVGIAAYHDTPFNLLNNTFLMGEEMPEDVTSLLARPEAVAICDVNDPHCAGAPFDSDPDLTLRGVANLSIQNNLIRTLPEQINSSHKVLLGIGAADTRVRSVPAGGTVTGPTNAFCGSLVGGTNGTFYSQVVGAPAAPKFALDLGLVFNDPPFVGEALAPSLASFHTYRDWRLLPSSSTAVNYMQDAGSSPLPAPAGTLTAENGTSYVEPLCPDFSSFDWDGEAYGNPRRVGEVDVGFDEVHGLIMAGCWANDTNNHNDPDPVIDPNGGQGADRRFLIFPQAFVGGSLTVNGVLLPYVNTPPIAAWLNPPGTLNPPIFNGGLPADYARDYIPLSNPGAPTPWTWATIASASLTSPVSGQLYTVGLRVKLDPEGPGPADYFDAQARVVFGGTAYLTNLQAEYR